MMHKQQSRCFINRYRNFVLKFVAQSSEAEMVIAAYEQMKYSIKSEC